jgi:hypothetical protein
MSTFYIRRKRYALTMPYIGTMRLSFILLALISVLFSSVVAVFLFMRHSPGSFSELFGEWWTAFIIIGSGLGFSVLLALVARVIGKEPSYIWHDIDAIGERRLGGLDNLLFFIGVGMLTLNAISEMLQWWQIAGSGMAVTALALNRFSRSQPLVPEPNNPPIPGPAPSPPEPPHSPDRYIVLDYAWTSEAGNCSIEGFPIQKDIYEEWHSRNMERLNSDGWHDSETFVDRVRDGLINPVQRISGKIHEFHEAKSNIVRLDNLLQFVHQFQYILDEDSTGATEYARYPIETLVEKRGDCECLSILLAALFKLEGYKTALLMTETHCMAGVEMREEVPGDWLEKDGTRYYICEATGSGWRVGEDPGENQRFQVREI